MSNTPLLRVEGLNVSFNTDQGAVRVIEDVTFEIAGGETLGLVGESGCGKSVTAQTIMRLLPSPPSNVDSGRIIFEGSDLLAMSNRAMQQVRGNRLAMIFQEPMTSLNPTLRIGTQIAESLLLHRAMSETQSLPLIHELLRKVGIGSPERRLDQYPHELSGGLRQRVMIAMAIACSPKMLIADEPTTALDVTIHAQIIDLLQTLQKDLGLSILLITHDLGVVDEMCRNVAVMYAGRIVEKGSTASVLSRPKHPYTAALIKSSPRNARKDEKLPVIAGLVPAPGQRESGCNFASRCSRALAKCMTEQPPFKPSGASVFACWNPVP